MNSSKNTSDISLNGHFIPNTHLDREWTMDFQHTRKLTVDFLNDLLEIMEKIPDYHFLLDAQAVPLEDYLEVMPENREKVRALIKEGRINAGPWYSALDMNCVSGESIIRNMHWGHLVVEQFGPVMKVGYTPFGWGQMSQLPQIYRGFGIDVAFFYRGVTAKEVPQAEFLWEGADGSVLTTSRFGTGARYNFYFDVWRKAFYTGLSHRLNRRFHWHEDAAPFKLCDQENRFNHGSVFDENRAIQPEALANAFRDLIEREKKQFGVGEIAFMHGMDTSSPDPREDIVLQECQKHLHEGETLFYSSLPQYAEAVRKKTEGKELVRVRGEVRHLKMSDYGFSYIANDIISARARQKAFMTQVESRLTRQAEPYAAMALLAGQPWPGKYLEIGWKQFLKCQPHDTVGGCGVDRLEEDAMYRLRDTLSIADLVSSDSLMSVQGRVDTSSIGPDAIVLTVFNPTPLPRTGVVSAFVDVPRELQMEKFELTDGEGNASEFTLTPTGFRNKVFRDQRDLALMSFTEEYSVHFEAGSVPALGYKTFVLRRGDQAPVALPAPESFVLENAFLRATVNPDGTVDLLNKETGATFAGLNYFADDGEVGHSWSHLNPAQDLVISSRGGQAELSWETTSSVISRVKAKLVLQIPATTPLSENRLDWRQSERTAENLREMPIEVEYTLRRGERNLEVKITLENQSRNHRLRALFPTGIQAESSYAEAAFDVVQRRIARDEKNPYHYFPGLTFPMVRFAGVTDRNRNFGLISGGLKEYEALDDIERTLALTIFRAYENNICTSGDFDLEYRPGDLAQSIGHHSYTYRICIASAGANYEGMFEEADRMHAPMIVAETKARNGGNLPMEKGFLALEGGLIFSGIKQASRSDALIVRLFNPSCEEKTAKLIFANPIIEAVPVNLNEEPIPGCLAWSEREVVIPAGPKKIVTLAIRLGALVKEGKMRRSAGLV